MKIRHMRFVLPSRMRPTVQVDARIIAEAAARALHGRGEVRGPISVQVEARGLPASFLARDVFRETGRQAGLQKRGGG